MPMESSSYQLCTLRNLSWMASQGAPLPDHPPSFGAGSRMFSVVLQLSLRASSPLRKAWLPENASVSRAPLASGPTPRLALFSLNAWAVRGEVKQTTIYSYTHT